MDGTGCGELVARRIGRSTLCGLLLAVVGGAGCAAFSNPTAHDSIPVHRLPREVFGKPREDEKTIPLTLLRQPPSNTYLLDAGDLLGVFIEGVLGERNQNPPLLQAQPIQGAKAIPPAVGYPIPVQEDGTLILPLIEPVDVRGLALNKLQDKITDTYVAKGILVKGQTRVIVTLVRPRTVHVNVIRQDGGGVQVGGGQLINIRRGTGIPLDLEAYENDVLSALNRSGGLPGLDAQNAIVIQRGTPNKLADGATVADASASIQTVRIPLRMRPNEPLPFKPDDILLKNGDIIFIESRETEVYYTGGLLPVAEIALPRDYDLDVLEAITQTHGPLFNGGFNINTFGGQTLASGLGNPSPSLLTVIRKTPHGGQITFRVDLNRAAKDPRQRPLVQPGDFLILQETPGEAFTRYVTQSVRFNFASILLRRNDATLTQTFNFP